jgi:N-acetylglucosaminyldiphosphoundecaprenol N-acetyl-beta-D-mannosaminyltransferase
MTTTQKITLFNIDIDVLTMQGAVSKIAGWVRDNQHQNHYVVTPNVDHVVNLDKNQAFKHAYAKASMVVADGRPVVWASRLFNKPLPEIVPGSDLVPELFNYFQQSNDKPTLRIFLLGAMPGVGEIAAQNIQRKWPSVHVVGVHSPAFGFDQSAFMSDEICKLVAGSAPDIVVFGVGAPKQELWCSRYAEQLNANVILCVGATIDFLAGHKARAPAWVRKLGLEWLHRMLSEPKRLVKRYLMDAMLFPPILYKEWRAKNK